jgi:hypothetical protein
VITAGAEHPIAFRKIENLHIFLWLIKDLCWCMDLKTLGMIMIVPTIMGALIITWVQRHVVSDLIHNLAVTMWMFANATWMIGEFYYDDTTRPWALVFFCCGLTILLVYYAKLLVRSLGIAGPPRS